MPIDDQHGGMPHRDPARPLQPRSTTPGEYVCIRCERGQCARCTDRACTCCYGNED